MATLTPRQPFGMVSEARLQNLKNTKNRQNAVLTPQSTKSLKRARSPVSEIDNDQENVDPSIFSPSKKLKDTDGFAKPQKFQLKPSTSAPVMSRPALSSRAIITPKRLITTAPKATPISAPVGGRSPKNKRHGILSRRRVSSSPFGKVDTGLPFSLDAALAGTVGMQTPVPANDIVDGMPHKWFFEIHEDTPEEELGNLVQHSTQTLDISDDESKAEHEDRGKENIPPPELAFAPRPVSRKDAMSDEPRTPLGDLNAEEFYADGCDATSIVIVDGEKEASPKEMFTFSLAALKKSEQEKKTSKLAIEITPSEVSSIEIWESDSAKAEAEAGEKPVEP